MNRLLYRWVAVLMAACLTLDPSTASAFKKTGGVPRTNYSFEYSALAFADVFSRSGNTEKKIVLDIDREASMHHQQRYRKSRHWLKKELIIQTGGILLLASLVGLFQDGPLSDFYHRELALWQALSVLKKSGIILIPTNLYLLWQNWKLRRLSNVSTQRFKALKPATYDRLLRWFVPRLSNDERKKRVNYLLRRTVLITPYKSMAFIVSLQMVATALIRGGHDLINHRSLSDFGLPSPDYFLMNWMGSFLMFLFVYSGSAFEKMTRHIMIHPKDFISENTVINTLSHEGLHALKALRLTDDIAATALNCLLAAQAVRQVSEAPALSEAWLDRMFQEMPRLKTRNYRGNFLEGFQAMRYALDHPKAGDRWVALQRTQRSLRHEYAPGSNEEYELSYRLGGMAVALDAKYPSTPKDDSGGMAIAFLRNCSSGMLAVDAFKHLQHVESIGVSSSRDRRRDLSKTAA